MDMVLFLLGFILVVTGILGSFLPVIPGPPLSWIGLLLLYLTYAVPTDWWILSITFIVALFVIVLDYMIPVLGAKKFGGSKAGMIGTTIGLVIALIFPVLGFFGIVIWPFIGALVGELLNKADKKTAFKAAFGSFLGFLTGTFLKFLVAVIYFGIFIYKTWEFRAGLFSYFS
jgi:uncharacterized protein YqgC (DUF456 family)